MPTELITNVINLAVLVVIGLVGYGVQRIYSGLPADKQQVVSNLAGMVVPAIEQQFPDMANPTKKIQAVNGVRTALSAIGIKGIPDNLIETAIEAAVYDLKQSAVSTPTTLLTSPASVAPVPPTK